MAFKEVVSPWFKTNKIGDFIIGTLVGFQIKPGVTPEGKQKTQVVYEILSDEGIYHNLIKKDGAKVVDAENPVTIIKGDYYQYAKDSIDMAMKKIKIGQKVKLIFDSTKENKDKMKYDFKLVKVYAGDMDNEYLKETYNASFDEVPTPETAPADDEIQVKDIPFN